MFGISFSELAIIGLLILIVMGPEKLPEVARWAGKGMRELRRASNTLRNALMLDEIDPRRQIERQIADDRPKAQEPSAVADKVIDPDPQTPPPPDFSGEHPAYAKKGDQTSLPAALDQVDEDHFQAILNQEYRKQSGLRTVFIAEAEPSPYLIVVPIEAHRNTELAAPVTLRAAEATL